MKSDVERCRETVAETRRALENTRALSRALKAHFARCAEGRDL